MTCRSVLSTARKEGRDKTVKEYAREINSAMYEKLLAERKNNTHAQLFNIYRAQQKVFPGSENGRLKSSASVCFSHALEHFTTQFSEPEKNTFDGL